MPFTLNNFFNAASAALPQGMNIGMNQMAEMQRRKELADEIARQQEVTAFNQRMAQQQFQRQREMDEYNKAQDQIATLERQKGAAEDLGWKMKEYERSLQQDALNEKLVGAKISDYQEGRAPTEAEFYWQQMTPEQRQEMVGSYINNKFKPNSAAGGGLSPSNVVSIFNSSKPMGDFGAPDTTMFKQNLDVVNRAIGAQGGQGQAEIVTEDQVAQAIMPVLQSGAVVDWDMIAADYPYLNIQAIKQRLGVQ